jgi:dihydrofolate reductase
MKISLIVAHGNNFELGLDNELLWHLPDDLKNFRKLTTGHHVLMGRKTFESIVNIIGKPLPNRNSLIISRNDYNTIAYNNAYSFTSFDDAVAKAEENEDTELFIIGGAQIYNSFIDKADRLYISKVDYDGEADAFLNPINYDNYELTEQCVWKETETTPKWSFNRYDKKV